MVRAWYGVISTGSQTGFAIDYLAEQGRNKYLILRFGYMTYTTLAAELIRDLFPDSGIY